MLKIKEKPQKTPAKDVTYETPTTVQKLGIEMLITLNLTDRELITGPDVDIDSKILVTKAKPHFFFNPKIAPESLNSDNKDSTIHICYQSYLGKDKKIELDDKNGAIRNAIDYLHNGTVVEKKVAKKKSKKKAAKKKVAKKKV